MAILFCFVAVAFLGGAVLIVRNSPPTKNSRNVNGVIAVTAIVLLMSVNVPWVKLAFGRFSSEEKDALARQHFDPAYGLARQSIENCQSFKDTIGGLNSLDISHRKSFVRQTGHKAHGFFGFDYVGSDSAGHLTVGFSYRESASDGATSGYELVSPYGNEALQDLRVFVYADGASEHTVVKCPWYRQDN